MEISSGSGTSEQSKGNNGYDLTEEDFVADLMVKDEPMHGLNHSSDKEEDNLAMDEEKEKLLVDFDGQISKKLVKSSPNSVSVYIVKDSDLNGEDEDLNLVNVDAHEQQNVAEKDGTISCQEFLSQNISKRKRSKFPRSSNLQKNKKIDIVKSVPKTLQPADCRKDNVDVSDLKISRTPRFSVKSFKDFTVVVDELCIDPELPDNIKAKYYTLCSDKRSFLHDRLMEGLNSKLISGIICEVVNISDSLKQCSLTTSREEFADWDRALKSFEFLGMDVRFLRTRIRKLVGKSESEGANEARKYLEAKLGRVRAEDEMISGRSKYRELEESCKKYDDDDVKALKSRAQNYQNKFKKVIDAPW